MAGRIVVGVDGSDASLAALRWAADEAKLRNSQLVALHGWLAIPPAPLAEPAFAPVPIGDVAGQIEAEREGARAELDHALEAAFPGRPPVEVERMLVEDDPAVALERQSKDADLVVVGSRGRSGVAEVLLGSVSRHLVHNAACPVVVVRGEQTPD